MWPCPQPIWLQRNWIHNPNNDNTYRPSVADFATVIGDVHWRGYAFDEPWEVVPGVWTIEIWQGDRKLLERSFTIQTDAAAATK
jgi:hypothetical protein